MPVGALLSDVDTDDDSLADFATLSEFLEEDRLLDDEDVSDLLSEGDTLPDGGPMVSVAVDDVDSDAVLDVVGVLEKETKFVSVADTEDGGVGVSNVMVDEFVVVGESVIVSLSDKFSERV